MSNREFFIVKIQKQAFNNFMHRIKRGLRYLMLKVILFEQPMSIYRLFLVKKEHKSGKTIKYFLSFIINNDHLTCTALFLLNKDFIDPVFL